jgi:lysophospholipase L1-like esterase
MKSFLFKSLSSIASFAIAISSAFAGTNEVNTAALAKPRDEGWLKRHDAFVKKIREDRVELLFLGDSITEGWTGSGKAVWEQNYAQRRAAHFGAPGERTQNLLWRVQHGEAEGIAPKAVVLLIGTANTFKPANTPAEISDGIQAIVKELRARLPETKVLVLAIWPRSEKDDAVRAQIVEVNAQVAKLDDGKQVRFLDLGPRFLEADGSLRKDLLPDMLHPNAKGYQVWAEAMAPTLDELMK